MAGIADDWNLDFRVVWHLGLLTGLVRGHGDLEAGGHSLELIGSPNITIL